MQHKKNCVNPLHVSLTNVDLMSVLVDRMLSRDGVGEGMGLFCGPSGYGKTIAACQTMEMYDAYYVSMQQSWSKKSLLTHILKEMEIVPAKTSDDMSEQVCAQLEAANRPLIIDEFDYVVEKRLTPLIRDLYDNSGKPAILLIGEEGLPAKLKKDGFERFDRRIGFRQLAQPANLMDAHLLLPVYCGDLAVSDCLLKMMLNRLKGSTSRLCENLKLVRETALIQGWDSVDAARWGERALEQGHAPIRHARAEV